MFILKKGHQPGVYVPLRALFLVSVSNENVMNIFLQSKSRFCIKHQDI